MSNRFTYTINDAEGFAVSIFDSECPTGTDAPNIYQPVNVYKGDEPFESREEAEKFAIEFIAPLGKPVVDNILTPPPAVEAPPAE